MPDTFKIPNNVREAVAKAICDDDARRYDDPQETWDNFLPDAPELNEYRSNADVAIQACLKEWGAHEEHRGRMFSSEKRKGILEHRDTERRLVFLWEPVEGDE